MDYHIIPVTVLTQNCSVIWCVETREGILVDPGGNAERIKRELEKLDVNITQILLTHGHLDHVGAAAELAVHYQLPIIGPHIADKFLLDALPTQSKMFGFDVCPSLKPDNWLVEGDQIQVGNTTLNVLLCPGHTPGHIVLFDSIGRLLISGDVIFKGSVGRSDFLQGSHNDLIASINNKLLPLGNDVVFIPGHGPVSTLGRERISNPFLR